MEYEEKRKKLEKLKIFLLLTWIIFDDRIVLLNMLNKSLSDSSPCSSMLPLNMSSPRYIFVLNYLQKVKK